MNMYLEHGLEYTKKFDETIVRVKILPLGLKYDGIVTAMREGKIVLEARIWLEEDDVSLQMAEAIAEWASSPTTFYNHR